MGIFGLFKPNVEKMKAERDVEGLIKALKHRDGSVRLKAVRALRELKDKRAVEPLIEALRDYGSLEDSGSIRFLAASALGELEDRRAIEPLIQTLKDESKVVRRYAAEALDRLGWKPRDDTEMTHYLIAKHPARAKARKRAMDWWSEGFKTVIAGSPEFLINAPLKVKNRGYAFCDVCGKKISVGDGYVLDEKECQKIIRPLYANLPKALEDARISALMAGTFVTDDPELEAKAKLAHISLGCISDSFREELAQTRGWAAFSYMVCDECIPKLIKE